MSVAQVRVIAWFSSALVLAAGCTLEAPTLAAPTQVRAAPVTALAQGMSVPGPASVLISFTKSADDERGIDLVKSYVPLRRRAGVDTVFAPFLFARADDDAAHPRTASFYDLNAIAGERYEYVVWAVAERDFRTVSASGAQAAVSAASNVVVASAPRDASIDGTHEASVVPARLSATPPENDGGRALAVSATLPARASGVAGYALMVEGGPRSSPRHPAFGDADRALLQPEEGASTLEQVVSAAPGDGYRFVLYTIPVRGDAVASAPSATVGTAASLLDPNKLNVGVVLALMLALTFAFLRRAQRGGKDIFIRRIPGVDAIEEAIGRATEMGRPVLYVPGIDEIQNVQTIASILVLGRVSELVARYDTEIKVPCCIPLVATVGEEVVRQGFYDAGRPDAHRPTNVQWISSEQFAFCAATNGIMLRDKPATNIFLGCFFGESLILAETGYVNRAIQIAGTAEITQLPFFIAACDYTLLGEELFAVSAYMSRDAKLLSNLKAADWVKALCIAILVVGTALALLAPQSAVTKALVEHVLTTGE